MPYSIQHHDLARFGSLEFLAHQVVEGFITGLHKSPFHGFSVEFAEHRLYNSGESTRFIDWKLFARSGKLFIKRFEEETNLRCQLMIDHSSSMYFPYREKPGLEQPDKLLFSVYAAASIMELLQRQRDAMGLSLFSDQLDTHTAVRSNKIHHRYLLSLLEKLIDPSKALENHKTAAAEALHQVAEQIHRRSLVLIFSDLMDENNQPDAMFEALQHLRYNKHEVVLFHVIDGQVEAGLQLDNRPYRFVDMETKEALKLNPFEIREAYKKAFHHKSSEIKLRCGQYQIDYVEADINKGYHHILSEYLIKRSKLY
ncbi:MAG: DUF58 domain-containing protein [Bacteroidales bacterium]|nr:DUF58 domain-containing protein [Bacteroidales bacterium]